MSVASLAIAARDIIRAHADYETRQVNVEYDENYVPATAGDLYVVVTHGEEQSGELAGSGSVTDIEYGIDIAVIIRSPRKPRDRKRDIWIDAADSFRKHKDTIVGLINFSYELTAAANVLITAQEPGTPCGFIQPLVYVGSSNIRAVSSEIFAASPGEPEAALIQTLRFRRARRIETL